MKLQNNALETKENVSLSLIMAESIVWRMFVLSIHSWYGNEIFFLVGFNKSIGIREIWNEN